MPLLKNLIDEKYSSLSKKQKIVADYLLANPDEVIFSKLDQLAFDAGVSTTSVLNFARSLGFSGFTEFQQTIRQDIMSSENNSSLPERLRHSVGIVSNDDLFLKSFQNDINNIYQTMNHLSKDDLSASVDSILKADEIYVLSSRSSFAISFLLGMRLSQIRSGVHMVDGIGLTYPEGIKNASSNDLCIATLIPRYDRMVAKMVMSLKKKGVKTLILGKHGTDELKAYGDIIIPCFTKGISFKSSLVSIVSVCNYLLAAVAAANPEEASRNLEVIEELLGDNFYLGLDV